MPLMPQVTREEASQTVVKSVAVHWCPSMPAGPAMPISCHVTQPYTTKHTLVAGVPRVVAPVPGYLHSSGWP